VPHAAINALFVPHNNSSSNSNSNKNNYSKVPVITDAWPCELNGLSDATPFDTNYGVPCLTRRIEIGIDEDTSKSK